ncbi:MAG: 50S ribosomal protein L18 [bacterium]|nr:50S ribosomal protein L18 [bacterium]
MTDRKIRVRAKIGQKSTRPRLSVFISNKHIFAQIIDDKTGKTLASARDAGMAGVAGKTQDAARVVGVAIAKAGVKAGVKEVVFDRGRRKYHGRVKALAQSAREGGLSF